MDEAMDLSGTIHRLGLDECEVAALFLLVTAYYGDSCATVILCIMYIM